MKKLILSAAAALLPAFALAVQVDFANFNEKFAEIKNSLALTITIPPPYAAVSPHPLVDAILEGNTAKAAKHLDLINNPDGTGLTPLITAVMLQQKEMLDFLISKGADVNLPVNSDEGGILTPLMAAAKGAGPRDTGKAILKSLLKAKGIKLDITNDSGWTALYHAANAGFTAGAELLLKAGADINLPDLQGRAPLMAAITAVSYTQNEHKNLDIVALLCGDKNIKINAADNEGLTALMLAAREGRCDFIDKLMETHNVVEFDFIDLNARDKNGKTAVQHAKNQKTEACLHESAQKYLPGYE